MSRKIKQITSKEINAYHEESQRIGTNEAHLLATGIEDAKRREMFGWIGCAIGSGFGLYGMTRPRPDPVVLVKDPVAATYEKLVTIKNAPLEYNWARDKGLINAYILNREGYVYKTQQINYDYVVLNSAPNVQIKYVADNYTDDEKRQSRITKYGDKATVRCVISWITPQDSPSKDAPRLATANFTTQVVYENGNTEPEERWMAKIGYALIKDAVMSERAALVNYDGFQVVEYTKDKGYGIETEYKGR